jgi:Dolichyl-phosphate-mannose-protein mannosyltransferase/DolP-mannose mannosyltransferase
VSTVIERSDVVDVAPPARNLSRRRLPLVFGALLLLTVGLRLPAFTVPVFNSDETFLATQAEVINDGGRLYHDAVDRKPPLVPYLYAAVLAVTDSNDLAGVRVLAMLSVALTALLLVVEGRRRDGPRRGWIAGLLFVFASVCFAPQDGQAANFEVFMLPFATAAILLARREKFAGSGVAVAVATLAKQTGAATLLPVLYLAWRARRRRGVAEAGIGFAVPLAIVALLVGPGQLLFWTVLGNGSYLGIGSAWLYVLGLFAVMTIAFLLCNLPVVVPLAWAWKERVDRDETDLWLWLLSGVLSVAVGFRFFGHYYLQLLPPLCLLSAGVLARASERIRVGTVGAAAFIAVGFSIFGHFAQPFGGEPQYRDVSRFIEANASKRDRILVWGALPEVYWASNRRPATRFATNSFYTGHWGGRPPGDLTADLATPGALEQFLADFGEHPPRYVVDTSPAAIRDAQYYPMSKFPSIKALVGANYHYVRSIDGIAVYERNASAPIYDAGS